MLGGLPHVFLKVLNHPFLSSAAAAENQPKTLSVSEGGLEMPSRCPESTQKVPDGVLEVACSCPEGSPQVSARDLDVQIPPSPEGGGAPSPSGRQEGKEEQGGAASSGRPQGGDEREGDASARHPESLRLRYVRCWWTCQVALKRCRAAARRWGDSVRWLIGRWVRAVK